MPLAHCISLALFVCLEESDKNKLSGLFHTRKKVNRSTVVPIKAGVGERRFVHFFTFRIGFLNCRVLTLPKLLFLFEETAITHERMPRMLFIMNLNFMMENK